MPAAFEARRQFPTCRIGDFMAKNYIDDSFPHFLHGGDYNPEQWLKEKDVIWAEDMRLMPLANCNEMTVGIFSWSFLEPKDGEYDFSFLDEIIEKIYQNGGRVILATPSGARPHWLADQYPEVLRVNDRLERMHYSERHNHCFTSPQYRRKVREIDEKLSARYGKHPAVLAWHISNEFGGYCHCPLCQEAFRRYLKDKYKTIDTLNDAYWTGFWSHTYQSFDQIESPNVLSERFVHGLNLDWRRFISHQTKDFMDVEIDAVRKYSDKPVTTNFMTAYYLLDYFDLAERLDFISWDSYPDWHCHQNRTASDTAFWHDLFRSIKKKPFLLMENAPGLTNWKEINHLKRPGMNLLAGLQAVAHGSDSVLYFQWRKGRGSSEKFHGAVVDHVGNEHTRVFREVAKTGELLKKIDEVCGSNVNSRVAIYFDWENWWALDDAQAYQKNDKKYVKTCLDYYEILWQKGISVDVVYRESPLDDYDLVILPMVYLTDERCIQRIKEYVAGGGNVYATYIFGVVNETDLCYLGGTPATELKEVFGIWSEEIDTLYPDMRLQVAMQDKKYTGVDYAELVHLRGASALATYETEFYAGLPALTVNTYGKGKAYYQAFRDEGDFKRTALQQILHDLKIEGAIPERQNPYITAHKRTDGDTEYLFVENYGEKEEKEVNLGAEYIDFESGEPTNCITLNGYGVKIFKRQCAKKAK